MQVVIHMLLAIGLVAALGIAIWTDLRARIIPNWLNAGIALSAPLWWWSIGLSPWPGAAIQLGLAAIALALFVAAFAAGAMGGGDVKLIAALGLWLLPPDFLRMLVWMSVAGGIVTVATLAWHRLARAEGRPEIPYGVAIACATVPIFAERYLYQFG
ncbi:A24 family peptidase [Sphingomonas sp.]|uniref:A24 family peptidase n=1 Tax=Sphingomonas sp. TaxID=28214 RepID=UPI003AFF8D3E